MKIAVKEISVISADILRISGVPDDHIKIIVDSIIDAHQRGRGTHGLGRLPIYVRKIQSGQMDPKTTITCLKSSPVVSTLDANHGFGQVAGIHAMRICVEKASKFGIGVATVRHSNNFGTTAFIAEEATRNDQIGIVLTNASPAIAPVGGKKPILGTNPLGIAFPSGELGFPISLDMATSLAARGKIRLAAKSGESIPLDWALDEAGIPTDDPVAALKGSMLALGGHKGYGLSLVIDILSGLLSGAAFGGGVRPLNCADGFSNNGHFVAAINIEHFMEKKVFDSRIAELVKNVKNTGEVGAVKLPGEMSSIRRLANCLEIEVSEAVMRDTVNVMRDLGLSVSADLRGLMNQED